MGIIKLKPACKDYIWGGSRLKTDFDKDFEGDVLAETWELSAHPDGPSVIVAGDLKGKSFIEYLEAKGKSVWGSNCAEFENFPILIKFIDAKQNLSVQVHPSDEYALKNEGQYGKTECWYIVDAEPGAGIYFGLKEKLSKEEFAAKIKDNTLLDALNFQPVKKGEMYFIKSGTLHAIGAGTLIAEIQQNSNVTYRVYDFGRVGADGKPRKLHIEKAIAVSDLSGERAEYDFGGHLAKCRYFTVDELKTDGKKELNAGEDSFISILITDGSGTISSGGVTLDYKKGDSFFIDAGTGRIEINGSGEGLVTGVY